MRGREARDEKSGDTRLEEVVEDRKTVAALDSIEEVPGLQEWDTLEIDFVSGCVKYVIYVDRFSGVQPHTQRGSFVPTANEVRPGANCDPFVTDTGAEPWFQPQTPLRPEPIVQCLLFRFGQAAIPTWFVPYLLEEWIHP